MNGLLPQVFGRHNLLIHADPGARSGFVAAWLTNCLTNLAFDCGETLKPQFHKIHMLTDANVIKKFQGLKIRIRPSIETIDLIGLLFLRKNVYDQIPNFTRDEYSLETFTKLTHFSQEIFEQEHVLNYGLYDIVLDFADTFDNEYLIDLYKKVVGVNPTQEMIDMLVRTNELNSIPIDKNHACSILKLCLTQEKKLGLEEAHRFWSIVDIYESTPVDQLYDTVLQSIVPKNYGILL
jgi:hypothetical protein